MATPKKKATKKASAQAALGVAAAVASGAADVEMRPITSAGDWKKKSQAGTPLQVPSGNTALVKNPGMQAFVKAGMIPNSLLLPVQRALSKGHKAPNWGELAESKPEHIQDMLTLVDKVTVFCVLEPKVWAVPVDADGNELDREEDRLYVDEIDPMDKMFIFQWVSGGTRDLEEFRSEYGAALAAVEGGGDVADEAQRPARVAPTKRTTPKKRR